MIDFLQEFHAGWRYLVILVTVGTIAYFAYGLATQKTSAIRENILLKIWAGVYDTQITLGLLLLAAHLIDNNGWYYDKFTGHWTVMLIGLIPAHGMSFFKRLNGEPNDQTRRILGLVLPITTLVLIIIGISALGISPFGRLGS